jgi:hypothetical protein
MLNIITSVSIKKSQELTDFDSIETETNALQFQNVSFGLFSNTNLQEAVSPQKV